MTPLWIPRWPGSDASPGMFALMRMNANMAEVLRVAFGEPR